MKKFLTFLAMAIMVVSLAACASGDGGNDSGNNNSNTPFGALKEMLPGGGNYILPKDGTAEGGVGDTMRTEYFDFTVNSVTAYGAEHAGYTADWDYRLLVLNLTVVNTYDDTNYMSDADFTLVGTDEEEFYAVDSGDLKGDFLPSDYEMEPGDKITGDMLFEVSAEMTDFGLSFMEYTDEDENTFTVHFQVEAYTDGDSDDYEDDYEDDQEDDSEDSSGGYQNGNLGDTMSAQQFDFKLNRAILRDDFNEEIPFDGYRYLVLEMTVQNKDSEEVVMYDSDFVVTWDDPDSYEYPMLMYVNGAELMDGLYELSASSSTELIMVYEVPEGINKFLVYYEEYLEDSGDENLITVTFVPGQG